MVSREGTQVWTHASTLAMYIKQISHEHALRWYRTWDNQTQKILHCCKGWHICKPSANFASNILFKHRWCIHLSSLNSFGGLFKHHAKVLLIFYHNNHFNGSNGLLVGIHIANTCYMEDLLRKNTCAVLMVH